MTDLSTLPFGLMLKPDRRQTRDRRQARRGGRRASDHAGFAVSFAISADEELAQVLETWGPLLRPGRTCADALSAR
ncbi:MAG: hypothetical protein R6V57_04165 [Vicinamibacterales bacterium]